MFRLKEAKVNRICRVTLSLLLALMLSFSMVADTALLRMAAKAEPNAEETQAPAK